MKKFILLGMVSILLSDPPFIPNVRVSDDAGGQTVNQGESAFDIYGENIYSVCNLAERSVIAMIPFARSTTGGLTWDPNIPFEDQSTGITWHTDPVVTVDGSGGVHMLIQFSTEYIKQYYSQDGGNTWIDTSFISDLSTGGSVDKPWMIQRGNKIYVTWQEFYGTSEGIRFARSDNNGGDFWRTTIDPSRYGITAIDIDANGVLYVAYNTWGSLYFTKSYNDGVSWTSPQYLSSVYYSDGVGDRAPITAIAAYGDGILFTSWVDDRYGSWDILGMFSTDGGANWSGPFRLNDSITGGQCKSWVTFDPYGGLHLFYYHTPDWPTSTSSLWSVRYQYSSDSGATFSPSIRITDTVFPGYYYGGNTNFLGDYHIIKADSNYIYAIWTDGRDGNMNLYFSRALLPQLSAQEPFYSEKEKELLIPNILEPGTPLHIKPGLKVFLFTATGRKITLPFTPHSTEQIYLPHISGSYFLYIGKPKQHRQKIILIGK